ncbi:MAG: chlorite dismutase family protein [Nitrospirae bacterium]|nr:chlorite dismutase family protein [Nitrospirota bacterium]
MFQRNSVIVFVLWLCTVLLTGVAHATVDREKLLSEPGVYGTFAVFQVHEDWWKLDQASRRVAAAEIKGVIQKHGERVAIDTYLLRGLTEKADFFVRVHSTELMSNQHFLVDLMGTTLGTYLKNTVTFNGIAKKANYVPGFPADLQTALKTPPDPGPKPYAIVIPIRKDADWWLLDQAARTTLMQEHAAATVPYLKTVKRKLYHATGLDDVDFITYFETATPADFNNLVIGLERTRENRHNKRFGNPTILGTIRPLDEILDILTR